MALNWSPEVIAIFIGATVGLICISLTYTSPKTKNIISLFYIRLGLILLLMAMFIEGLSYLFMSLLLYRIFTLLLFPAVLLVLIGINYTMKESFISINIIILFSLGIFLTYLIFQPGTIEPAIRNGYPTIIWVGLLVVVANLIQLYYFAITFYWGLKTWRNAPFLIKKEVSLFFLGIIIMNFSFILFALSTIFPNFILLGWLILNIGISIIIISIIREPKVLYILPFTVYRLLVKDKEGFPLFDHDWSKSDINETIFTGFINAVQLMSEELMHIGGLVDIQLEEGILILHESEFITVGLVTSKSSKLLRESLIDFSDDFQKMFERELKKSVRDMSKYEAAYGLIEKYFSNFPYRIITSKNYPLILTGKYVDIPLELENKLRHFITDEKEYEFIISELIKYPPCVSEDILNLYGEVKEEPDKLPKDDYKYLDSEFDEETSD